MLEMGILFSSGEIPPRDVAARTHQSPASDLTFSQQQQIQVQQRGMIPVADAVLVEQTSPTNNGAPANAVGRGSGSWKNYTIVALLSTLATMICFVVLLGTRISKSEDP